jgi:hypothetical protein
MPKKPTPAVAPAEPTIKRANVRDYLPAEINPNKSNPRGVPAIVNSLHQFGAGRSIIVDRDGEAIGGSHTLQAAIDAGITDVIEVESDGDALIVHKRRDLDLTTDAKAKGLQIADNRTSELGYLADEIVLKQTLEQIGREDARFVEAAGYDAEDIRALVDGLQTQIYTNDYRGETPDERLDTYLNATIKQVVLMFDNDTYDDVIQRLAVIRKRENVETNTLAFLKMLEVYEYHNG